MLLDTCTLLWLVSNSDHLSSAARAAIQDHRGRLFVSAISAFEIGIKARKRKLSLPQPVDRWFSAAVKFHGLRELVIDGAIASRSTLLPPLHADPSDRLIIATSQIHHLTILTPDHLIKTYPDVRTLW